MPLFSTLNGSLFAAGFAALTFVPGVWTLATTPVSGIPADVISGAAQRQYEDRFETAFPLQAGFRHAWAAVKFGALGEMAEGAVVGSGGVLFTAEEFTAPSVPRDLATALATARDALAATGTELIPVIVPDKARMMAHSLPHARSARFDRRYDAALAQIARSGLPSVDLRPALSGPRAFMATDTHWSPEGARASARAIAALIGDRIVTEASFETRATGTQAFDGDLVAFADTGPWRGLVGPAPEQITTYHTGQTGDGAMDLFGDADTPVALVGTSYSARDAFHFTGFLKSELGADVISFAQEGLGPFTPMDRFLRMLDDPAFPTPQIVLWEIPERYLDTWSLSQ